jgi:PHS family inorganic phosphate transporter-like MFS transporter
MKAFNQLDEAKLGWFHLKTIIVAGVGFFADAYDIFVISLALPMIYQVYYPNTSKPNGITTFTSDFPGIDALMKASTNWGNLIGQLAFGYLGDKLGRKKMYGVELLIMITATIGSCIAAPAKYGFDILTVFPF